LKVGLPSAKEGLSPLDPTITELLKPQDYVTAQFGKNNLGDRNEFLPTVHGFDEFFGNLYHLNAEEEPEHLGYPKNPTFRAQFGPHGVLKCFATATDTPGGDPRFGPWGKQRCEDTGPLTKMRMETIDEEFVEASLNFIDRATRERAVRLPGIPLAQRSRRSSLGQNSADQSKGASRDNCDLTHALRSERLKSRPAPQRSVERGDRRLDQGLGVGLSASFPATSSSCSFTETRIAATSPITARPPATSQ
jgi:arylsulfatase A-like enzyme